MDPGSTDVHVDVSLSSVSFQIVRAKSPVLNVIRFWNASPNAVSSPILNDADDPSGDTTAVPVTVSVPIVNVNPNPVSANSMLCTASSLAS